jgi:Ser/Thr protein kinase RdoA (MazF antagonist)
MHTELFLQKVLAEAYGLHDVALHPTSGGSESDKLVFRLVQADKNFILRVYPPENRRSNAVALTSVLHMLEKADYPAERCIAAADGAPFVLVDGWRLVLSNFVEGVATDQIVPPYYELGAVLGRLHALFTADQLTMHVVPIAERSMEAEMAMSLDDLLAVALPIPAKFMPFREELMSAMEAIDRCTDLPDVLIHNDFQPGNIVQAVDGSLTVIDWDGAGRCPAILDLGYLISSVHPSGEVEPDAARIQAIMGGYSQHYHLSPAELERLSDAIRFRPITYLTSDFAAYIASNGQPDPSYLDALAAYHSADEAAEIARKSSE